MTAVAYWQLGSGQALEPVGPVLGDLALFGTATFGLAAFGYLLNDVGDRDADRRSGAPNAVSIAGPRRAAAGLVLLAALAAAPWFWLPVDALVLTLLGLEVGLFAAYVLPPVRLKDRGAAGIAADATYGYVIPLVVAMLVFADVAGHPPSAVSVVLLVAWSFLLGVRQILAHQLVDAGRDERAATATFALRRGWRSSLRLLERVTWAEALVFPALLLTFGPSAPVALAGLAAYVPWVLTRRPARDIRGAVPLRRLGIVTRTNLVGWNLMSTFHVRWLPLLLAGALAVRDPAYCAVLAGHLLVFTTPMSGRWRLPAAAWRLPRQAV